MKTQIPIGIRLSSLTLLFFGFVFGFFGGFDWQIILTSIALLLILIL